MRERGREKEGEVGRRYEGEVEREGGGREVGRRREEI